jgi:1,4-alpha-glucan branching enzyme
MDELIGRFCLVLHGHLPYVLHHGRWPHGEDWLFEAAAETYIPLLQMIDEVEFLNLPAKITVGLTPVLLEQLAHPHFKQGFRAYLTNRIERADADRKEFESRNELHLAYLARRWADWFGQLETFFSQINDDLPGAYAERAQRGWIELLTSCATHGYMPLLLEDACCRAQIRAGVASSERLLGFRPTGMWLPECAYRPAYPWTPPAWFGDVRNRIGIEHIVADEGITHFFVENHLIEQSRSEGIMRARQFHRVGWDHAANNMHEGWYDVHEPVGVNSDCGPYRTAAFGRDPKVCEQVWSGALGYPASGPYLEFHKKYGERRGLRYWKVTHNKADLGEKDPYYPDDVPGLVHEHAAHFCNFVKDQLRAYQYKTGRLGTVTASFDAELFGHWWFEGPQFIRDVLLSFQHDPQVELCTTSEVLERQPPDKVVALPEGSWGDGGDHSVWFNDQTRWIWEVEYRAEAQFGKMSFELPWETNGQIRELLERAGRELLLMQASDWPFVIRRGQAVDYGTKRFVLHAGRFENLIDMCEKLARGGELNEVEKFEIQDADIHDVIFPKIDLNWWHNAPK